MDSSIRSFNRRFVDFMERFPILRALKEKSLTKLRMFQISHNGNVAVMVSHDGKMYVKVLDGSSFKNLISEHMKSPASCDAVEIAFGYRHILALTKSGQVFAWGDNSYSSLANDGNRQTPTPCLGMSGIVIKNLAAGKDFSMALSEEGRVYCWGLNNEGQCGNGSKSTVERPKLVTGFAAETVVAISCGEAHCMALTDIGILHSWGRNTNSQLGRGTADNLNDLSPRLVDVKIKCESKNIIQVSCGANHTLVLCDDGMIAAWGLNTNGQIGPRPPNAPLPQNIKFIAVAANNQMNISTTKSEKGSVFFWGGTGDIVNSSLKEIDVNNLDEIIARFNVTYRSCKEEDFDDEPLEREETPNGVLDCLAQAFDNVDDFDLIFCFDDKKIHAHKFILQLRSDYFKSMFGQSWKEERTGEIKVTQYKYQVYKAFLKYLYTDQLEYITTVDDAMDLLELAHCYGDSKLKKLSEKLIRKGAHTDNLASVYALASKYECEDLQNFCVRYTADNYKAVTISDAYLTIEADTARWLMFRVAELDKCDRASLK